MLYAILKACKFLLKREIDRLYQEEGETFFPNKKAKESIKFAEGLLEEVQKYLEEGEKILNPKKFKSEKNEDEQR